MWYNYINLLLQSLILHSPKVSVLIHGLFGFTHYYFYLLVQYGNTTTFGTYSKAAVQTVMTSILGEWSCKFGRKKWLGEYASHPRSLGKINRNNNNNNNKVSKLIKINNLDRGWAKYKRACRRQVWISCAKYKRQSCLVNYTLLECSSWAVRYL